MCSKARINYNKIFFWIIIIVITGNTVRFIVDNLHFFTRRFEPDYFGQLYSQSQYVIGQLSKGGIGDDGLYAFAGYYYLFQGGDVSAVNFEHPPLGKYLIGVSILLFKNENIINLIYFCILLIMTYKMGKIILKSNFISLLGIAILAFDPLLLDNLLRSLLELPFTLFVVTAVYFFTLSLKKDSYLFLSMLFWGAAFSVKFFPFIVIIYLYLFIIIFVARRKSLKIFLGSSFLILTVYLITHLSFFIYHPSLLEFVRHKKWMLSWFKGSPSIFGNIWRNVFHGIYIDPTGKSVLTNNYWTPIIPLIVILAVTRIRKAIFTNKQLPLLTIYGFCLIYLIYLTVLTSGQQRFLMPIYPLLIILSLNHLSLLFYSIMRAWKKHTSSS